MKKLVFAIVFVASSINAKAQNEYIIHLNDTVFEFSLDQEYKTTVNGNEFSFTIKAKDTLLYHDDFYSFNYLKDYKISKMVIDEGIEQIVIMTAEGSGIMIQKYTSISPTLFNEMMISEVTKESLNYGFELTRQDYDRTLKSGQKINVDKAVLTYKEETNTYEVASIGNKDEGILIMTMIMDENYSKQGRKIINLMWESLNYK
ncbi:MAG: hypothetical protein OEX22_07430 [Cyclobacteriaceae bacterium]|nr:hypothetical protein [Cyclobacteriaceae bacterium]